MLKSSFVKRENMFFLLYAAGNINQTDGEMFLLSKNNSTKCSFVDKYEFFPCEVCFSGKSRKLQKQYFCKKRFKLQYLISFHAYFLFTVQRWKHHRLFGFVLIIHLEDFKLKFYWKSPLDSTPRSDHCHLVSHDLSTVCWFAQQIYQALFKKSVGTFLFLL